MSNPNPYNSPYGNTPQQDYGTQPQPNAQTAQGWDPSQPAYTQPQSQPDYTQPAQGWGSPQSAYAQPDYQQPAYAQQPAYQQPAYMQQSQPTYTPGYSQQSNDSGSFGWAVLGFFIPLVGLILWLVWKDSKPKSAKMSGIGALVGVGVSVLWWLVGMSMLGSMMQYGM